MPVLKYRPSVGAPWQVVGVTQQTIGLLPQIIVTAPTGSIVTCSKGNTTLNAEEINETWTFNVPEYGEWTILVNVSGYEYAEMVSIDSVKQYNVQIHWSQTVNYTMLYDNGNEQTTLTGGWTGGYADSQYTYGGDYVKNADNLCLRKQSDGYPTIFFRTNNPVDINEYSKVATVATYSFTPAGYSFGWDIKINPTSTFEPIEGLLGVFSATNITQSTKKLNMSGEIDWSSTTFGDSAYVFCMLHGGTTGGSRGEIKFYNLILLKSDNWSALCSLAGLIAPSTMDELLSNADAVNAILSDKLSVDYMLLNCTGDFMASAVASETFLTALEASPYKDLVYSNEHWAKFLAMV